MSCLLSTGSLLKLTSFVWWGGLYLLSNHNFQDKTPEWHSRVITLLHGSIAAAAGLSQCKILDVSIARLSGLTNFTGSCTNGHYALMLWSWGYFAFDLLWCFVYWTETTLMICHHTSALVAITTYLQKDNTGCSFACTLALLEVTNPLLQIRWFLRSEGFDQTTLFKIIEAVYLTMFVSVRGIFGTYVVYKVVPSVYFDMHQKVICLVFYFVSIGFIIEIFGFVAHKYKSTLCKYEQYWKDMVSY